MLKLESGVPCTPLMLLLWRKVFQILVCFSWQTLLPALIKRREDTKVYCDTTKKLLSGLFFFRWRTFAVIWSPKTVVYEIRGILDRLVRKTIFTTCCSKFFFPFSLKNNFPRITIFEEKCLLWHIYVLLAILPHEVLHVFVFFAPRRCPRKSPKMWKWAPSWSWT